MKIYFVIFLVFLSYFTFVGCLINKDKPDESQFLSIDKSENFTDTINPIASKKQITASDSLPQAKLSPGVELEPAVVTIPLARTFKKAVDSLLYYCHIIDFDKEEVKFYWKDSATNKPIRRLDNLKKIVEADKNTVLLFASNAGMYTPDNAPQGLYIQDGKLLVPVDTAKEGYGNFYMQPNGIFVIDKNNKANVIQTKEYLKYNKGKVDSIKYATQSGPMLVVNGVINPLFKKGSSNLNIRNGVGITHDEKVVLVISDTLVNLYDFATFFKDSLQCRNALYLDGAISRTYLPALNRHELGGNFGPMIGITNKTSN